MTPADYIQELARIAGIDPSSIELVDCSGLDNTLNAAMLAEMMDGSFEVALKGSQ